MKASIEYLYKFLEKGYIVVTINYALTPDYRYPVPIIQANDALHYIEEHGAEYGIDVNNIVISGNSAGGQIAGQLANVQTNKEYAEEMELEQCDTLKIKGVLLNCGLLNTQEFGDVGFIVGNWLFGNMGAVYFQKNDENYENNKMQANVIEHATKNFPAAFITDGNSSTFTKQALALEEKLKELGVYVETNIYTNDYDNVIGHDYQDKFEIPEAVENLEKQLEFFEKVTTK